MCLVPIQPAQNALPLSTLNCQHSDPELIHKVPTSYNTSYTHTAHIAHPHTLINSYNRLEACHRWLAALHNSLAAASRPSPPFFVPTIFTAPRPSESTPTPAMASGGASPLPSFPASRTSTPSNLNPNAAPRRTKICVYCGSSPGNDPVHMETARALARAMAANDIGLGRSTSSPPPLPFSG